MFLSLKQQVSNTNNDVSTFESKLHELKEQTDMAISFHNNFIKSDESIMKREAGGQGEFLLCPQGKAASPRFMGLLCLVMFV